MTPTIIATVLIFGSGTFAGYSLAVFGVRRMLDSGELTRRVVTRPRPRKVIRRP